MYAIFENGNKQYKACVGDTLKVEKLNAEIGSTVEFPVVLTADENGVQVGSEVAGVKVSCEVVSQGKEKKIIVFKYKAKKNERKKLKRHDQTVCTQKENRNRKSRSTS